MCVKVWTFAVGIINQHLIHSLSTVPALINDIQIKMTKSLEFDHAIWFGVYRGQWKHLLACVDSRKRKKFCLYIYIYMA